jgi:hypothetical protein
MISAIPEEVASSIVAWESHESEEEDLAVVEVVVISVTLIQLTIFA